MNNDSTLKTLIVATLLCIICSILVSGAAVKLKTRQQENKKLDIQKNILLAAGLIDSKASKEEILENFKKVETKVIDLESGNEVDVDPDSFDAKTAAKDPKQNYIIPESMDIAKIKRRAKYSKVYFIKDNDQVQSLILPVHGKGLWSTMYGFVALAPDTTTVKGFGFYEHGETPGLGGEIDNPNWKKIWIGKQILNNNFQPAVSVIKGSVDNSSQDAIHKVDGLSGATITSVGVQALINYWAGDNAFSKFLKNFRSQYQSGGQE